MKRSEGREFAQSLGESCVSGEVLLRSVQNAAFQLSSYALKQIRVMNSSILYIMNLNEKQSLAGGLSDHSAIAHPYANTCLRRWEAIEAIFVITYGLPNCKL